MKDERENEVEKQAAEGGGGVVRLRLRCRVRAVPCPAYVVSSVVCVACRLLGSLTMAQGIHPLSLSRASFPFPAVDADQLASVAVSNLLLGDRSDQLRVFDGGSVRFPRLRVQIFW